MSSRSSQKFSSFDQKEELNNSFNDLIQKISRQTPSFLDIYYRRLGIDNKSTRLKDLTINFSREPFDIHNPFAFKNGLGQSSEHKFPIHNLLLEFNIDHINRKSNAKITFLLKYLLQMKSNQSSTIKLSNFSQEDLKILKDSLKSMKNTNEISLSLENSDKIDIANIFFLFDALKIGKNFNIANLALKNILNRPNDILDNLRIEKKDVSHLKQLGLVIEDCPNIDLMSIDHLSRNLFDFQGLKDLKLKSRITDGSLSLLSSSLSSIHILEKLDLEFQPADVSDKKLVEFFSDLSPLSKIKFMKISLDILKGKKIGDEGLIHLAKLVSNLKNLNAFHLIVQGYKLPTSDISMREIINSIKKNKSLNELTLWLTGTQLTDSSVKELVQVLRNYIKLEKLHINFYNHNKDVTANVINQALKTIKGITCLLSISLKFGTHNKISNLNLQHLAGYLSSWKYLRYVDLGFCSCLRINDSGLIEVANSIGTMLRMKIFKFELDVCPEISTQFVEVFCKNLHNCVSIVNLSLRIKNCLKIRDEEIRMILKSPKFLKLLKLYEFKTDKTYAEIDDLLSAHQNSESLEFIEWEFSGEITEEDKKACYQVLKKIPKLSRVVYNKESLFE